MYRKAEENSITCIQVIHPQAFLEHIIVLMQLPLHASKSIKTALSIYIIITVATANDKSKNILTWNGNKSLQLKTNSQRNPPLHKHRAKKVLNTTMLTAHVLQRAWYSVCYPGYGVYTIYARSQ